MVDISYLYVANKLLEPFILFIATIVGAVSGAFVQDIGEKIRDRGHNAIGKVVYLVGVSVGFLSILGGCLGVGLWGLSLG